MKTKLLFSLVLTLTTFTLFCQMTVFDASHNTTGLALNGDILYVADTWGDKIFSVNLNDSTYPANVILDDIDRPEGIEYYGGYLFIAANSNNPDFDRVIKLNVSEPNEPPVELTTSIPNPRGLVLHNNKLYVSSRRNIYSLDLEEESLVPELIISDLSSRNGTVGLCVWNNYLYVSDNNYNPAYLVRYDLNKSPLEKEIVLSGYRMEGLTRINDKIYSASYDPWAVYEFDPVNGTIMERKIQGPHVLTLWDIVGNHHSLYISNLEGGYVLSYTYEELFNDKQPHTSLLGSKSTQWNMNYDYYSGQGTTIHTIIGDTIINGKEYKIIGGYAGVEDYYGFMREDTLSGKAWYCNSIDTTEFLIMDMNLNVGDAMYIGGNWNSNPGYYKVDSVYYINGRKYIQFDFNMDFTSEKFTLIQGIGSNLGFRFQDNNYAKNVFPLLLTAYKNSIQIFDRKNFKSVLSSTEEYFTVGKQSFKVYPNPFADFLKIEIPESAVGKLHYKIFDTYGKIIMNGKLTDITTTANISEIKTGIYLIAVYDETKSLISTKKIAKTKNN